MPLTVEREQLLAYLEKISFEKAGDALEQRYWGVLKMHVPNMERFWRYAIVPSTNRLIQGGSEEVIRHRPSVEPMIKEVGALHHSLFANWLDVLEHILAEKPLRCVLEDTFFHLASICDLTDKWLLDLYLIVIEATGATSHILQELSRKEFTERAQAWYDTNYSKLYEFYYKIGKRGPPLSIVDGMPVLDEFASQYGFKAAWKPYVTLSNQLRAYRNVTTHHHKLMTIANGRVPTLKKISDYKRWEQIEEAARDPIRVEKDFIEVRDLVAMCCQKLMSTLNELWVTPTEILRKSLYDDRSERLLEMYDMTFA